MNQELTERIKDMFPQHAAVIESAEYGYDPADGHLIAEVQLAGTRAELDAFYDVWDATKTGLHITTAETETAPGSDKVGPEEQGTNPTGAHAQMNGGPTPGEPHNISSRFFDKRLWPGN